MRWACQSSLCQARPAVGCADARRVVSGLYEMGMPELSAEGSGCSTGWPAIARSLRSSDIVDSVVKISCAPMFLVNGSSFSEKKLKAQRVNKFKNPYSSHHICELALVLHSDLQQKQKNRSSGYRSPRLGDCGRKMTQLQQ